MHLHAPSCTFYLYHINIISSKNPGNLQQLWESPRTLSRKNWKSDLRWSKSSCANWQIKTEPTVYRGKSQLNSTCSTTYLHRNIPLIWQYGMKLWHDWSPWLHDSDCLLHSTTNQATRGHQRSWRTSRHFGWLRTCCRIPVTWCICCSFEECQVIKQIDMKIIQTKVAGSQKPPYAQGVVPLVRRGLEYCRWIRNPGPLGFVQQFPPTDHFSEESDHQPWDVGVLCSLTNPLDDWCGKVRLTFPGKRLYLSCMFRLMFEIPFASLFK